MNLSPVLDLYAHNPEVSPGSPGLRECRFCSGSTVLPRYVAT